MGKNTKINVKQSKEKVKKNSNGLIKTRMLSIGARDVMGRLAGRLLNEKFFSRQEIIQFFQRAGLSIPQQTLSRWIILNDSVGAAVPVGHGSGAPRLLQAWQEEVVAGYVLQQNLDVEAVHRQTVVAYVMAAFGIQLTELTAGNYLDRWGFSVHKLKLRDKSYVIDRQELVERYCDWLQRNRLFIKTNAVCSMDFTYTSHRTREEQGFSLRGGGSPEGKKDITRYTNCIVNLVWADGVVRTPCVLFTFNPSFRKDRCSTGPRDLLTQHLDAALKTYGIGEERVIYCGAAKGETRTYCGESPTIVKRFFELYPLLSGDIEIFTDDGHCFLENGEDVFAQMGFKNHRVYEPAFHHFASPNDNNIHGVAKKKWRERFENFTDDVETSLALMKFIDDASKKSGTYFQRNLQIGGSYGWEVVKKDVEKVCHAGIVDCSWRRLQAYRLFEGMDGRGEHKDSVRELSSGLDGIYYQQTGNH